MRMVQKLLHRTQRQIGRHWSNRGTVL